MCSFDISGEFSPGDVTHFSVDLTATDAFVSGDVKVGAMISTIDVESVLIMESVMNGGNPFELEENNNVLTLGYDTSALTVTINHCPGQVDPAPIDDACFTITFNKPVPSGVFTIDDIVLSGGAHVTSLTQNSSTQWTVHISGMTLGSEGSIELGEDSVQDYSAVFNNVNVLGVNTIRYGTPVTPPAGSASGTAGTVASGALPATGTNVLNVWAAFMLIICGFGLYKHSSRHRIL